MSSYSFGQSVGSPLETPPVTPPSPISSLCCNLVEPHRAIRTKAEAHFGAFFTWLSAWVRAAGPAAAFPERGKPDFIVRVIVSTNYGPELLRAHYVHFPRTPDFFRMEEDKAHPYLTVHRYTLRTRSAALVQACRG